MIDLKSNVPADLFTELHSAEGSAGAPARAPDREATVGRWRGGVGWIRPGEPKRGTWWWFLALTAAALLVRLHWNLEVHPPGDYIYSDMRGYMSRASRFFERGLKPDEYEAFYPYGTHMFLWLLQVIFGRDNHSAMAVVYAVIGAGTVGWTYALAARVSRFVWVAPAVGLTLVFYYPLIALGGYFLSETPSSLFLVGSTYFLIRLIDEGGWKHAFMAGLMVALGFPFRPQLVVPVALFAPVWLIYRKRMPNVTIKRLLVAVAPLLVVVALSSWRMHHHTERFGLISENGLFNQVFGRCHNKSIVAMPDGKGHGKTSFGPPAHIQLSKRDQDPKKGWPQLDPALGLEFEFRGYIADREILQDYIHKCVAKTGTFKQIEYTVVNMLLLWRYNVMWPDSGKREWVPYARLWALIVVNAFAVPPFFALLALFFPRHWLKLGVVSLHLVALLIVGGMYMGSFRIRTLYDPILLLLAFEVYAVAVALLATAVQRHVVPRFAKGRSATVA